ncbi:hypothetical protein T4A_6633 [Trichinella pseudospiralis]|uniref:Uncharacterized protein n=1 Tax=Trichinella pseudospiralis TaxID=6337 RepID=A0A0V1EYB6_TRIPS|nr:hypothetical protein T4A_6633 [Trichinella pseudospiralis]
MVTMIAIVAPILAKQPLLLRKWTVGMDISENSSSTCTNSSMLDNLALFKSTSNTSGTQHKQGLAWKEVDLNIAGPLSELTVGMAGALMHCPWKSNPTG